MGCGCSSWPGARSVTTLSCDACPPRESVLIEDLTFNSILVVANRALAQIAADLNVALDPELATSCSVTAAGLEELWDESAGQYFSRNAVTGEHIGSSTVATFLPLWAGVPADRARRLVALLRDERAYWPAFPVPSVAVDAPGFDPNRYWKGPTWVNMNWMIVQGLLARAESSIADELRLGTLDLVDHTGFYEYFSPVTGRGFGADEFSWTAALVIDLLEGTVPTRDETTPGGH